MLISEGTWRTGNLASFPWYGDRQTANLHPCGGWCLFMTRCPLPAFVYLGEGTSQLLVDEKSAMATERGLTEPWRRRPARFAPGLSQAPSTGRDDIQASPHGLGLWGLLNIKLYNRLP